MNTNYENNDTRFAAGNGQGEMDLPFPLFLYHQPGSENNDDQDDFDASCHLHANPNSSCTNQDQVPYSDLSFSESFYHHTASEDFFACPHPDLRDLLGFSQSGGPPAASPRIEITCPDRHHHHRDHTHTAPVDINRRLAVPPYQNPMYRENASPASSNSSTSWHSEAYSPQPSPQLSPCVSPSGGGAMAAMAVAELCPRLQAIHPSGSPGTSPTTSPRTSITEETFLSCRPPSPRHSSRSTSPQGKRTYEQYQNPSLVAPRSRSPSPHAGRDEQSKPYEPSANLEESVDYLSRGLTKTVPTKVVRPNQEDPVYSLPEQASFATVHDVKRETGVEALHLCFTQSLEWPRQLTAGMCSVSVASLPGLDWVLPSSAKQYELSIEVQPRAHHRAHYETEGSRGPVKAASGGHPVVQLRGYGGQESLAMQIFIGTADDRPVRPHAFYQVHRITGKTVTTCSCERIISGTKVLELILEPKENMRAV